MGAHSTQKLIEFRSTKIDEGLPILRAFCGSAIISNDLRSHRKILRRTLGWGGHNAAASGQKLDRKACWRALKP